jgi:hypothetical protein
LAEEEERIRRLREASQILDEELRQRIRSRREQFEDLKNASPQKRDQYFDPEGEYPYGIIEAINNYK